MRNKKQSTTKTQLCPADVLAKTTREVDEEEER
jgi:hypothetical protein